MFRRVLVVGFLLVAMIMVAPSVAVAKTKTKMSVSVSSSQEHADYDPILSGQLKTSRGKAVSKKSVVLYCNGRRLASARTNSKGRFSFRVVLPEDLDAGNWTVKYAGDRKYGSSKSRGITTARHIHFSGPATSLGTDVDGYGSTLYVFGLTQDFAEGGFVDMYFSSAASVMVGYPGGALLAGSNMAPVNDFRFYPPTSSPYFIALTTQAAWGGGGQLDVVIW